MSLQSLVAACVRYSGLPRLIRHTWAANKATILLYHDPEPECLDRHLAYLSRRYHFVTLDRLVDAIHAQDWSGMPQRALVITIDDGHRGNARLGDVFRKYGCRPTIYLCSQLIGTLRHFWFEVVKRHDPSMFDELMHVPNAERLRLMEERIGYTPTREYPDAERQALSFEELKEVAEWADLGSHGRIHPILTTCDETELESEFAGSRKELTEILGSEPVHFCYPNGDYGEREIDGIRKAGYRSARTIDVGWNSLRSDPYKLRICGVTDDASVNKIATQMTGVTIWLNFLRAGGGFTGRKPITRIREA